MTNKRYLTKSKFKLAIECPAKLFYADKTEYANQKVDDSFLLALADGGFQVGELAKYYFSGGHSITTLDYEEALLQTNKLLEQENVIIYEAAISSGNLFIRVDILIKKGNFFELYEVKAKSFDPSDKDVFYNKKDKTLKAQWKPYLYDVAFQKYVIRHSFPQYTITAYLMLADKTALCPTDGLNQKFRLIKGKNGRKKVSVSGLSDSDLTPPILYAINVDNEYNMILPELIVKKTRSIIC